MVFTLFCKHTGHANIKNHQSPKSRKPIFSFRRRYGILNFHFFFAKIVARMKVSLSFRILTNSNRIFLCVECERASSVVMYYFSFFHEFANKSAQSVSRSSAQSNQMKILVYVINRTRSEHFQANEQNWALNKSKE